MANDFFSALTEGGQTISQPSAPSTLEALATDLVSRGLNHFFGDPVQDVNLARQQLESANRALTEGLTLKEAGVDIGAIDKVLPGYSATLLGAENLPSFRQRRAFAQQVFAPEGSSMFAPPDTASLQQNIMAGELHHRRPFAGLIGQEPQDATIRQRMQALPPAIQTAQFGIPAQEDVRNQLAEAQIKAETTRSTRGQVAALAANLGSVMPGVTAPQLRRMARHIVLGKPLNLEDYGATTAAHGGGGGLTASDLTSAINSYNQHYQNIVRPAMTDQKWQDLKPRDKQQYSPEMIADRNIKRVPEVVEAAIQDYNQLTRLAQLQGIPGPSEDIMTYLERSASFVDERGNLVTLAALPPQRSDAIRGAIRAQLKGAGGAGPGTKEAIIAEGKGEGAPQPTNTPRAANTPAPPAEPTRVATPGFSGQQPIPTQTPLPTRTPKPTPNYQERMRKRYPGAGY